MEQKTPSEIETACLAEIAGILEKHRCEIQVSFQQDTALGTPVLKYQPIVVYKGKKGEQSCIQL